MALGLALTGAVVIAALDARVTASASGEEVAAEASLLSVDQAVAAAVEQGLSVDGARAPTPRYDSEYGTVVWRLEGEDTAIIDARTGVILEASF